MFSCVEARCRREADESVRTRAAAAGGDPQRFIETYIQLIRNANDLTLNKVKLTRLQANYKIA